MIHSEVDNQITDEQMQLLKDLNKKMGSIKNMMEFFVILTVLGIIAAIWISTAGASGTLF